MVLMTMVTLSVCISSMLVTGEDAMTVMYVPSSRNGTVQRDNILEISMNQSILTKDEENRCFLCGIYGHMDVHHIFGGPCRKVSDRLGLVVHLCRNCHRKVHEHDHSLMEYLHQEGQQVYEDQIGSREEFIRDFIRSYL